jgi:hypothetical protein
MVHIVTARAKWLFSAKILLNLWRQNPQVHHRIHKSPVPILSQIDTLYTPTVNLPKIHSDLIIISVPWSPKWSLSFWLSHQNLVHFPLLSHSYESRKHTL